MRIKALKTISTRRGTFAPGEIFEMDDGIAKRLIEAQAAEMADKAKALNEEYYLVKELAKLKIEELKRLAEILDIDVKDEKKAHIVEILAKNIPESELEELDGLEADEMRAYLGE